MRPWRASSFSPRASCSSRSWPLTVGSYTTWWWRVLARDAGLGASEYVVLRALDVRTFEELVFGGRTAA